MEPLNSPSLIQRAAPPPAPPALSGSQSLSVMSGSNGKSTDVSRAWLNETMPADVQVSAAVYVNSLIPAQVIARGSYLNAPDNPPPGTNGPSFYAVELASGSPGPVLTLVKDVNGSGLTTLATIQSPTYINNWLEVMLDVEGPTVRAQLFDPKAQEYLSNNNGTVQWQTTQAWVLTVIDNSVTGPGVVGLGRPSSYVGTVTFDDFSVQTPATDQSFDAAPVGQLPENWTSYASRSGATIAVAAPTNPTPTSPPNALAITPVQSSDTDRAWLNTSLPADLSVSAETYLDTLTPAQIFARGSGLTTSSPTYYAVEVSRGLTVSLIKVVNGTQTTLGTPVTSTGYVQNIWVQETLGVIGNSLEAQIYRPDTQQYLTSQGGWQSTPTWAIQNVTDTSITGGGQVGVGRPVTAPLYLETTYLDDFTTATGMDAQNFDSSTSLSPSEWSQSSSNQFSVASVGLTGNYLSAANVLQSTGGSAAAQIWDTTQKLTNAQVSAGMYVSVVQGAQLIARGTNLGTSSPSYYGLSVTPTSYGLDVYLVRVNNGTSTTLAELSPLSTYAATYFENQWVQATLYVDGPSVRTQIYRADTGQYLNSEDMWQSAPAYALNYTDTSSSALTGPGNGGLARTAGSSGTVFFDNFAVVPLSAENTPPSVSINVPGGTLSGPVTASATATDDTGISKVDFYVEDNPTSATPTIFTHWEETAGSSYNWNLDTTFVPNGTHWLVVQAYDDAGNMGEAMTSVTISNNTALSLPSGFPTHTNTSVGITELDYEGTAANQNLVQSYVDTVVGDGQPDAGNIHSWDSSVQQLVYTNVSNIYLGELTNWLNYAEQNGIDPEQAFYHVSAATPWTGDVGDSTKPVDQFWGVYAYQDVNGTWQWIDDTAAASDPTKTVVFGSSTSVAGETMNVAYTDKFREIDVKLTTDGSGGSYVLEYPSAVDSLGNPTTWSTLTTQGNNLSDGTNGLTQSGTITFDPPSNWVPAVVDSSSSNGITRFYYVRFRSTTPFSTIPVASTILGYDYTHSQINGDNTTSLTIPAFDYAADKDGDGYLNAQEYANRAPGMDAYFAYQGRLFSQYGPMRFSTNPSSPDFRQWALTYCLNDLKNTTYATGLFVDNSENNPPGLSSNYNVVEPTDSYTQDYASLLNAIGLNVASVNGWIMANVNGANPTTDGSAGQTNADPVVEKVQSYYEEKRLRALAQDTSQFETLSNQVNYRSATDRSSYAVLDSMSDGSPNIDGGYEQDSRMQLATLAAYYLLAPSNPSQGALDFFGGESPSSSWVENTNPIQYQHWSPAAGYNIGTPTNSMSVLTTGPDPENTSLTYTIFQRLFTGQNGQPVLVLYKPLSQSSSAEGTPDDSTATTYTLSTSYYLLQADGTLSSTAQTTVTLRNGEGAILIQAGTNAPALAGVAVIASSGPTSSAVAPSSQSISSSPSFSQGSPSSITRELPNTKPLDGLFLGLFLSNTASASQVPMVQPSDPHVPWADLDRVFSLLMAGKPLKTQSDSSPSDELFWPADADVAALFSITRGDDPLNSSSAS